MEKGLSGFFKLLIIVMIAAVALAVLFLIVWYGDAALQYPSPDKTVDSYEAAVKALGDRAEGLPDLSGLEDFQKVTYSLRLASRWRWAKAVDCDMITLTAQEDGRSFTVQLSFFDSRPSVQGLAEKELEGVTCWVGRDTILVPYGSRWVMVVNSVVTLPESAGDAAERAEELRLTVLSALLRKAAA